MPQKEYKYSKKEILERTNGGLDVILHYYPEAVTAGNRPKNFSLSDISGNDDNPSSAIVPNSISNGYVVVKEFNSGDTWSCFDIVSARENLSNFADICAFIFNNIIGEVRDANKSIGYEFKMRLAKDDEKVGDHSFDFNEKFSKDELLYFGPYVTAGLLRHFKIKSVDKFHQIIKLKNKKTKSYEKYGDKPVKMTKGATDAHYIFCVDEREENAFAKIYTPQTKDFRFQYVGDKPDNHCFGLDTIPEVWENHIKNEWVRLQQRYDDKKDPEKEIQKKHGYTCKEDIKLPEIIIAGGDRDAINVASMGFPVVWLNSETATYTSKLHHYLKGYANRVIQLGDIDDVGIEQMNKRAKQFIDLYTLYLPESLRQPALGSYSKPGKDMTDWVKRTYRKDHPQMAKNLFNKMIKNNPLKAKFWNELYKDGKFYKYEIDNEDLMHFMQLHGFYKYRDLEANKLKEGSEDDFYFVKWESNRIKKVIKNELQNFPLQYTRDRNESKHLRNTIHKSPQITDKKLERLNFINPKTKDADKDYQMMYFKDNALYIGTDEIKTIRYENLEYPVWDEKILDHFISGINVEKPVEIFKDDQGYWDVKIMEKDNPFLMYMVNTSRIHWRKKGYEPFKEKIEKLVKENQKKNDKKKLTDDELQKEIDKILDEQEAYRKEHNMMFDEPGLTDKEIRDQKQAFVNKWFAFGFYLHNYRSDAKPWFPVAMDNHADSANTDSKGRSGKSFLFNRCMRAITNTYAYINAADIDQKSQTDFLLENVEKTTTNVVFDDANVYFPYKKLLFNAVTGDWIINKKNKSKFSIKSENRPVPAVTSNHGIPNVSESFTDRMIFVPFGDYYHGENKEIYQRKLKLQDDIGMDMFSREFDHQRWLQYFNTIAHCIQFAIDQDEKINPPMENVNKKNLRTYIGEPFMEDANTYFFKDPAKTFDQDIEKSDLMDEMLGPKSRMNATNFKKRMKAWCEYHHLIFNPLDLCTKSKSTDTNRVIYNGSFHDPTKNSEKIHVRLTESAKIALGITEKDLKSNGQKRNTESLEDVFTDDIDENKF